MIDRKAIFFAFIYSFIFGFSFLFTKITLGYVDDVYHLLALRFLTAFVIMTVLVISKAVKVDLRGKNISGLVILSFLQPVVYFIFETNGIMLLSTSQAGIMIACIPVFTAIFSGIIIKEKTSSDQKIFIALSVIGAIILNTGNHIDGNIAGSLYLFAAVCSAGLYCVLSRSLSGRFSSFEITYFMMGAGTAAFNLISITRHIVSGGMGNYLRPLTDLNALPGLIYLGALSSVAAFFLMNYTLSRIQASRAALFSNLTTLTAVLAGVVFLHESFGTNHMIGGAMILAGVYGAGHHKKKL
jgi:drug/metabolite transporter (DMT)-like permease